MQKISQFQETKQTLQQPALVQIELDDELKMEQVPQEDNPMQHLRSDD